MSINNVAEDLENYENREKNNISSKSCTTILYIGVKITCGKIKGKIFIKSYSTLYHLHAKINCLMLQITLLFYI